MQSRLFYLHCVIIVWGGWSSLLNAHAFEMNVSHSPNPQSGSSSTANTPGNGLPSPSTDPDFVHPYVTEEDIAMERLGRMLSEAAYEILAGWAPQGGVENHRVLERNFSRLTIANLQKHRSWPNNGRPGFTQIPGFKLTGEGVINVRYLGGPYFFESLQGGLGFEVDFHAPDDPTLIVALRFLPVYGELAVIRVGTGGLPQTDPPRAFMMGSALGGEIIKRMAGWQIGAKSIVRTLADVKSPTDENGISMSAGLFARLDLTPFLTKGGFPDRLALVSSWNQTVRQAKPWGRSSDVFHNDFRKWPGYSLGSDRTFNDIRSFWEFVVGLEYSWSDQRPLLDFN